MKGNTGCSPQRLAGIMYPRDPSSETEDLLACNFAPYLQDLDKLSPQRWCTAGQQGLAVLCSQSEWVLHAFGANIPCRQLEKSES